MIKFAQLFPINQKQSEDVPNQNSFNIVSKIYVHAMHAHDGGRGLKESVVEYTQTVGTSELDANRRSFSSFSHRE